MVLRRLLDQIRPGAGGMRRPRPRGGRVERLLADGSGATRQRRTFERTGQLVDVVAEAVRLSAGG